ERLEPTSICENVTVMPLTAPDSVPPYFEEIKINTIPIIRPKDMPYSVTEEKAIRIILITINSDAISSPVSPAKRRPNTLDTRASKKVTEHINMPSANERRAYSSSRQRARREVKRLASKDTKLKKYGFKESFLYDDNITLIAVTAKKAAIYLKPPVIPGIKYPKKTPIETEGRRFKLHPAAKETPNGLIS
ncbi:MAG: hypothetical protein J6D52_13720, partial [Clostridia bacterium]|nr:hypothetical protein [Clostridia bacterium]